MDQEIQKQIEELVKQEVAKLHDIKKQPVSEPVDTTNVDVKLAETTKLKEQIAKLQEENKKLSESVKEVQKGSQQTSKGKEAFGL